MLLHLTKENFDATIASGTCLVDFWAQWCGPCRMIGPILENMAEKFEGKAKICKVNVDEQGELAVRFNIMTIPSFIVFKDGQEVDKKIGVFPQEEYEAMLGF